MAHKVTMAATETLTGTRVITTAEFQTNFLMSFDPGGAGRTVTLPAEADVSGEMMVIANAADAAEILTIQSDGASTVATPTQNEVVMLFCDGTNWFTLETTV